MMLSPFIVAIRSTAIILQFDGSLRPPRDPIPGFTHSPGAFAPHSAKQHHGGDKLASCSATISLRSPADENSKGGRLVAVGGRYLPIVPGMTSADAEYDGLLLGLDWLVRAFSSWREEGPGDSTPDECDDGTSHPGDDGHLPSCTKLIIRGDCKVVIDQLRSRSVPRKMEEKHNSAMDRIRSLEGLHTEHQRRTTCGKFGKDDASMSQDLTVCFEHIPREKNCVCDALCKLVVHRKQMEIVESTRELIRLGVEDDVKEVDEGRVGRAGNYFEAHHGKRSRKRRNSRPKNDHFQRALGQIRGRGSRLCHSSRLALACELARASIRRRDAAILTNLSAFFSLASRRWPLIYYGEGAGDSARREALRKIGIASDELSEAFLRTPLERLTVSEYRGLLHDIESISNFCTAGEYHGNEEDADLSTNPALKPYSDISTILVTDIVDELDFWISGIQSETWQSSLCSGSGSWKIASE